MVVVILVFLLPLVMVVVVMAVLVVAVLMVGYCGGCLSECRGDWPLSCLVVAVLGVFVEQ